MNDSDVVLAGRLATRAGELLIALRSEMGFRDQAALRKAGDRRSNELLVAALADERPDDAVLSEESADDLARLDADRVWIVDPLDGTTEFGEEGRTDWAVHVALWERSASSAMKLTAGAVALPGLGRTLTTAGEMTGASTDMRPLPSRPAPQGAPRLAVSRTRRPSWFDSVAERTGAVAVPIGSAGMKGMSVVLGDTDAYLHSGRMKEWDSAAPVAVAAAAGLHVSRLDGSPLEFNTEERLTLDLLICYPSLADQLLAAVEGLAGKDATER
ncbi:MAG TPA: 3'(2'),5'-bisphosphate nucleotidase CysQ [Mycobacteriales bacterium]|nr:3'(2'),5'-bisphosphate nucleotidase CysQ [Mycobacteriales bacterium]